MSERILIVDDESATRSAFSMLLRREGFEVADASDRPTALAKDIAFRSDLILLGIMRDFPRLKIAFGGSTQARMIF